MKKILSILILCIVQNTACAAGYVAFNATISGVFNTSQFGVNFGVRMSGTGTGTCAGANAIIQFNPANFPSIEEYKRAFALATTAYLTGKRVDIWDNSGTVTDCSHADFIEIHD